MEAKDVSEIIPVREEFGSDIGNACQGFKRDSIEGKVIGQCVGAAEFNIMTALFCLLSVALPIIFFTVLSNFGFQVAGVVLIVIGVCYLFLSILPVTADAPAPPALHGPLFT
jgi:hypothetical protein